MIFYALYNPSTIRREKAYATAPQYFLPAQTHNVPTFPHE